MKKKSILFLIIGMALLAGCGRISNTAVKEDTGKEKKETTADGAEEAEAAEEAKDSWYTWEEITVTLPKDWVGRCVMLESESGFSICQKASYEENEELGFICGFYRTEELVEDINGETLIAYTDDGILYYLVLPLDVPCDIENKEITGEYMKMSRQLELLKASVQIKASGIHYDAEEYVLPTSGILPLKRDGLMNFSDNDLWIARNEIYARHGRQFNNEYLQRHFDQCTWYEGTVAAEEFQESDLSQIEKDNIKLLTAAEQEYDAKHPYPKKYKASETAAEDLTGDGTADKISYQVTELENGEYQCRITVNGQVYIANELAASESEMPMTNPIGDGFFIVDIYEGDGALEIAVFDEGPSEDPITFFFRYLDDELTSIGQVPGNPFGERNDSFNGVGGIIGRLQMDLIETAYLQGFWWYDRNRIIYQDLGWYDFETAGEHILYEDLPVYYEREESSETTVIPAQERVFFLGSDGKQWILVKGKDGKKGYMLVQDGKIVGLNKSADKVFSDLRFFD